MSVQTERTDSVSARCTLLGTRVQPGRGGFSLYRVLGGGTACVDHRLTLSIAAKLKVHSSQYLVPPDGQVLSRGVVCVLCLTSTDDCSGRVVGLCTTPSATRLWPQW